MLIIYKIEDIYCGKLSSHGTYMINGEKQECPGEVQMKDQPDTIFRVVKKKKTVHYEAENGMKLSTEVYLEKMASLESKATKTNYGREFGNLDDEYNYKKFMNKWKEVTEIVEEFEPVKFTIHEITGRTDNKYIQPLRLIGKKDLVKDNELLYSYSPSAYNIAKDIAKYMGFEEVEDKNMSKENTVGKKWSIPSHGHKDLKYIKINGSYAHTSFKIRVTGITAGTWGECINKYNAHYEAIKRLFDRALNDIQNKGKKVDVVYVTQKLTDIMNEVRVIDHKVRSKGKPRIAVSMMRELINDIRGTAI